MNKKNHLWVVESKIVHGKNKKWEPCIGFCINVNNYHIGAYPVREYARIAAKDMFKTNQYNNHKLNRISVIYRVKKYITT